MPLPANSTLILQGQPRPEDTTLSHLKPKKAMLIRMSQETFEALEDGENHSKVEFDFGKTPGLYIGNTFYPVMPTQEQSIHEMYIRVQQASKQNVPLKPYATVVGKFRVQRELGEKVQETVRDRTLEAEKQRTGRKAILLDTPPDLSYHAPKTKTKKHVVSVTRTTIPAKSYVSSSKPSPLPSSSSRTSTAAPLPSSSSRPLRAPTPVISSADRDTRTRLIHCLALSPRSMSTVLNMCLGRDRTEEQEQEIVVLLEQVAEHPPTAKKSEGSSLWQLKLEAWREVRPYEFTKYSTEERRDVARQARLKFQTMKIPETDPIWNHVHYRNTSSAASGSSAPAAEKNGVVMTKNKKPKTGESARKKVSDIAIPSKDESAKGKARDIDEGSAAGTPTSATRPPARRLPGSGFRVKPSATPPIMEPRANSPLPPPRKTASADVRESKRSAVEASGSGRSAPPVAPPPAQESSSVAAAAAKIRKREKDVQGSSSTSRAADNRREERPRDRERERIRERESTTDEKPRIKERASPLPVPAPPPTLPSFKRKKRPEDGNESEFSERERPIGASASKKRKLEADTQPSPVRGRDLSLPKKPVVRESSPLAPPRPKIKKEASPFSAAFSPPRASLPPNPRSSLPPKPPIAEKQQSSSSNSSARTSRAVENAPPARTSSKPKRKSPIYTSSSEDESEASVPVSRTRDRDRDRERVSLRDAPSEEPPVKRPRPTAAAHVSRFKPRQLPSDLPSLRKYYKLCYGRYMDLFGEAKKRRERIQRMLKRVESTRERGEESARSDEDNDELVPEVLAGFMDEMNAVSQEMKKVMKEWKKLGGKEEGGKPVLE